MSKSQRLDVLTGLWRNIAASSLAANASVIAEAQPTLSTLCKAVGRPGDLSLAQWAHLYALTLQYRPDVIVELGRGYGNSTCVFALAAQKLRGTQVLSFCLSDDWERYTVPAIKDLVDDHFFDNLQTFNGDFTTVSFNDLLKPGQRVLLFWDAHGYRVAEFVLSNVMPVVADNEHLIVMHDIADNRYCGMPKSYDGRPLWSGMDEYYRRGTNFYNISWLTGVVDQAIPVLDFCFRNDITLHSADEDVNERIEAATQAKLAAQLPPEIFPQLYHWAYFTLNEAAGPYHFPPSVLPKDSADSRQNQVLVTQQQPAISCEHSPEAIIQSNCVQTNQTISAASAIWNQRQKISEVRERLGNLYRAVNRPGDLSLAQWAQWFAMALEFKPDLIVELGRGAGNSTCVFTEAASLLADCHVVSLCLSDTWQTETCSRLEPLVRNNWFNPLETRIEDILSVDIDDLLTGSSRVLVLWDAHGYDVAEFVLGGLMPQLQSKRHLVIMHDISDRRYAGGRLDYGGKSLWRGNNDGTIRLMLGHLDSAAEQVISIVDFVSRNTLVLHSSDQDLHEGLEAWQVCELTNLLGSELFCQNGHWFWFSLNEKEHGQTYFPRFVPPTVSSGTLVQDSVVSQTPVLMHDTVSTFKQDLAEDCNGAGRPGLITRLRGAARLLWNRNRMC